MDGAIMELAKSDIREFTATVRNDVLQQFLNLDCSMQTLNS
ncbi:hypothetical protein T3H97_22540 [Paenibacillus sp. LX16]|nr:hypothetical protein [Paenibacillus sp. LX16]